MTMAILRFNFAAPQDDPAARRDRIQAALELSSWSETRGVSAISFDEHHQSGHGCSSNPIMTAAVLLARTERARRLVYSAETGRTAACLGRGNIYAGRKRWRTGCAAGSR